ncbi:MAG TPA: universal stress protein [Mucilaginibacter sp.]|jgi:nucleotide-binding universal stress UspA family protein
MKTLLVATDFSANAKHAAEYGYSLAAQLKKNLILCNAFSVPAEVPDAGFVSWTASEYDELNKDSEEELKELKDSLIKNDHSFSFKPTISVVNELGSVTDVLNTLVEKGNIEMTVMATHGNGRLGTFLLGNHSRKMIDAAKGLLMLVPVVAAITPIKKIAFATGFTEREKDLQIIKELIEVIRPLNAELLVSHIIDKKWPGEKLRGSLEQFLEEISKKVDYPHIHYRIVRSEKPEKGLNWLCHHGQVDVLAMVHRGHGFFNEIINGSHTKKMADLISIPLLVIPENLK